MRRREAVLLGGSILIPGVGFGPSRFRPADDLPTPFEIKSHNPKTLLKFIRAKAPKTPGVYGMLGTRGQLIYVGKAKNLRSRLLSYFRVKSRDPKAGKIIRHTYTLLWEPVGDEFAAFLRELELIRRYRPRFNVMGQPGRQRYVYLCIGRGPVSYAYLTREPNRKDVAVYGPFVGRRQAIEAVRWLNFTYHLRDCPNTTPMRFAEQPLLVEGDNTAKCLRYELGTCLGPCVGLCSQSVYSAAVKGVRAFLDGKDRSKVDELTERMQQASNELRFEHAMVLRDRIAALEWLEHKLHFLRTARSVNSFVYPLVGADDRTRWYVIHGGEVQTVMYEPTCMQTAREAVVILDEIFTNRQNRAAVLERCIDSVLIVSRWFRVNTNEKPRLLTPSNAGKMCKSFGIAAA